MEIRELKYYKWVFDNDKIILVNKKLGEKNSFILSMAMADSFCRAYISFKNKYRIEQTMKWKNILKKTKEANKQRVERLRNRVISLENKK